MDGSGFLIEREASALLVVDVQQKLAPAIHDGQRVIEHCIWLARLAIRLGVPVTVTEHCPDKIGTTVDAFCESVPEATYIVKRRFSAQRDGCLVGTEIERRAQVIVCGTETHVCVQQTALDLVHAGKRVFLVADAVGSRRPLDHEIAIARMRNYGVDVVTREMVAFEWLGSGDDVMFSEINREFLR